MTTAAQGRVTGGACHGRVDIATTVEVGGSNRGVACSTLGGNAKGGKVHDLRRATGHRLLRSSSRAELEVRSGTGIQGTLPCRPGADHFKFSMPV